MQYELLISKVYNYQDDILKLNTDLQTAIQNSSSETSSKLTQINYLNTQKNFFQSDLNELQQKNNTITNSMKSLKYKDINSYNNQINTKKKEFDNTLTKLSNLVLIKSNQDTLNALNKVNTAPNNPSTATLNNQLVATTNTLNTALQQQVNLNNNKLAREINLIRMKDLQEQMVIINQNISSINSQLTKNNQKRENEMKSFQNSHNQANTTATSISTDFANIQTGTRKVEEEIDKLTNYINNSKALNPYTNPGIQINIAYMKQYAQNGQKKIPELQKQELDAGKHFGAANTLAEQASTLTIQSLSFNDEKKKLEKKINELSSHILPSGIIADSDIAAVNNQIKTLQNKLADINKQLGKNSVDLKPIADEKTRLQNQVNTLKKAVGITRNITDTDINNTKTTLLNIRTELETLNKENSTLNSYLQAIKENGTKLTKLNNEIATLDKKIKDLQSGNADINKINQIKNKIKQTQKEYIDSLEYMSKLSIARKVLEEKQAQVIKTVNTQQQSLNSLSSSASLNSQILSFASGLSTQTRLAKLSNPSSQDIRFSEWIDKMKGKALAANNTNKTVGSDVSPTIYSYDKLRLNSVNNLWINLGSLGGTSNGIKNIAGTLSIGYDAFIKNIILGLYGTYAYTTNSISNSSSKNTSHSGDFGVYTRIFAGKSEIDLSVGEVVGYNELNFKDNVLNTTLNGNNLGLQTHVDATYGYVFNISKNDWFVKPYIGVGYNYGTNDALKATSDNPDISMDVSAYQTQFISGNIGVELRKYFDNNQSYFFISPEFYQGVVLSNNQKTQTRIYSTYFNSSYGDFEDNKFDTAFVLKAGGEWQASQNTFLNVSIGAKLGNISQYATVSIGGRWKF
ncbi:autotransporter outer membrane beta-barrel domain-containing protein [Helicobacter sp. 13S00477-4]|uniref:autotransporter outer membrane beta-barrel domain-containing protein n=1 Tax=Helicobacter sp. 13S00477-4 TaxID=1905759 RepID=UPI000BA70780|nr:autotransporter outer membrane beta-barrel domain-containing protein [Helicobacter sp. 13S00477-4]PAF52020.1 hypothetical protein BKH44_03865 [Helicobacter sp. 13S00477-4]